MAVFVVIIIDKIGNKKSRYKIKEIELVKGMTMPNPEIVQATSNGHHLIVKASQMITKGIFKDPTAFDATNDIFKGDPSAGNNRIDELVSQLQLAASRFLFRLIDNNIFRGMTLEAGILQQLGVTRKGITFLITNPFIVPFARIGLAQITNAPAGGMSNEIIG